jgi:hypothetical protein
VAKQGKAGQGSKEAKRFFLKKEAKTSIPSACGACASPPGLPELFVR